MDYPMIVKGSLESFPVTPNLSDYQKMREDFKWEELSKELDWFDSEHINIGHIAVDAHLKTERRNKKALIWESQKGEVEEYTFAELARLSNKFANILMRELGIQKGDRVFWIRHTRVSWR